MLAGRKLLLADDSITIQKVVDLTFTDEGVNVLCASDGREAIAALEWFAPDVVLADVFMPELNGYELCEYIKQNDKFKNIPVMLLVGSFEPFDEEEARRVGANDILTKPFQSIRRLIERVGLLSSERPPEEQIPTAELPKAEEAPEPVEKLSTAQLEITTADTQPLPPELQYVVQNAVEAPQRQVEEAPVVTAPLEAKPGYEGAGEVLLDLGDFKQARSVVDDDFVLDLDLDEIPEPSPVEPAFSANMFRNRASFRTLPKIDASPVEAYQAAALHPLADGAATTDQLETPQGYERVYDEDDATQAAVQTATPEVQPIGSASVAPISASDLSPEMIDAIAKRAVEQLSEKVVQEIAWEVVPQLAELLIKRQLEEKNS